jgi:predicted anti-sigma-YlaC factor YlaD
LKLGSFRTWIRQIYGTRDDELDCNQVFERMAEYVDQEVAGHDPSIDYPKVAHHLIACSRCRELHDGVLGAAQRTKAEEQVEAALPPSARR